MPESRHPTSAHYFLEGLNDVGIDYIFSNFGIHHVDLSSLESVNGFLNIQTNTALTRIDLPSLSSVRGTLQLGIPALVFFPAC